MSKSCAMALVITAALISAPVHAGDTARDRKVIFEAAVRIASEDAYKEIVRQAWSKGWRFTPEQIKTAPCGISRSSSCSSSIRGTSSFPAKQVLSGGGANPPVLVDVVRLWHEADPRSTSAHDR